MDQITIIAICCAIIISLSFVALRAVWSNSENSQSTERPPVRREIVKERKSALERPGADLDPEWLNALLQETLLLQGGRALPKSQKPRSRSGRIILYHYTSDRGAMAIKSEMLIRSSDQNTQPQHRRYGLGVYFTSYSPHDLEPDKLALNCFTHKGTVVTSPGIYSRTRYVVEIEFDAHEVQKIHISNRDVYIFRGSINLGQYRYTIYKNPRHPYDPKYSFYVHSIGY